DQSIDRRERPESDRRPLRQARARKELQAIPVRIARPTRRVRRGRLSADHAGDDEAALARAGLGGDRLPRGARRHGRCNRVGHPRNLSTSTTSPTGGGGGGGGAGGLGGGSTDPKAIIQAAGCLACHKLDGQGQVIAPDLTHVGSRRDAESIRKKILDPASSVTKGYEKLAGIMPKSFGTMMNAAQLEALVQYLAAHK